MLQQHHGMRTNELCRATKACKERDMSQRLTKGIQLDKMFKPVERDARKDAAEPSEIRMYK